MSERRRIDEQPSFILHSYAYRETSLILDVFSRDYGRVSLAARGARRPRSALRGVLMAFQPLELSWSGSGEVMTLMKAEWQGGLPLLTDTALFVGYHLNELLMHLLPREDSHPRLFDAYYLALHRLADGVAESHIRSFEKVLLQELGYGLTLDVDVTGAPLDPSVIYRYDPERGAVASGDTKTSAWDVYGKTLLDIGKEDYSDSVTAQQAKQLMRQLIQHQIGEQPLTTRRIFQDLQDL